MFRVDEEESFSDREKRIMLFWEERAIFKKSLENRKNAPLFSFYDGPPFATGLPHYGHLLAGTIKDVIPRYKTMKGFYVPRRFGWDCHGLPVENEIEKGKELSGALAIEEFGIENFNEECRSIVLRYAKEWESTVLRMGRWLDFSQTYRTMDPSFMESVWWVFSQLYEKELVYEGFKVMPFSAQLGTPLSNFEANLNYQEVDDPSLTVCFALKEEINTSLLVWTTTPWTLPSNLAVMVHPNLEYVKVKREEKYYILAKTRLSSYFKEEEIEVVATYLGKDLKDFSYEPVLPYFSSQENAFRVLLDDSVEASEGTGIVHAAPAFGEVDFFVCLREGIELVCPVDQNGKFTKEITEYEGMFVRDANKQIIRRLKEGGQVFHIGQIRHRYPFCWRSDTPLIYKAVRTWFVSVEKLKEKMLEANQKTNWIPGHVKEGRFGKWLEGARDWAISRNRYWGTPIPIWRNEKGECRIIGSVEELEKYTGEKVDDLHRHHIDHLTFTEGGEVFTRIPEVFDCWFESGSMPYAQNHYPFENREETEKAFPADFIGEGLDQTRGWFYTLTVIGTALFGKAPFKNVIVNGIILAEDGTKMSKRLKNYPEPQKVIDQHGADAIRLYLLHSPAVVAEDLNFTQRGVELTIRQVLLPLWNAYRFFSTYATINKWEPSRGKGEYQDIDRWLISLTEKLTEEVTSAMDTYHLSQAVDALILFIEQLTNWYIRRCRSRFWRGESSPDQEGAFAALYEALHVTARIAAPFIPFLSEAIFQGLRKDDEEESIHLTSYPTYSEERRDLSLENEMDLVQVVVNLGHALRKEHKCKVRQPLGVAHLATSDDEQLLALKKQSQLIKEELNVKEIVYHSNEEKFVTLYAKPNFPVLGKKVGKRMNVLHQKIKELNRSDLQAILEGKELPVLVDGEVISLQKEDITIDRKVCDGMVAATAKGITIALDTTLTEELLLEGLARELVNKINTMRREEGFAITDRVKITLQTTDRVRSAYEEHKEYIMNEVLAKGVAFSSCEGKYWDLNGEDVVIALSRSK